MGRHSDPFYRIVAADSRFARDGRYIEQIGVYDPAKGLEGAIINEEIAMKWLQKGALPSDSIRAMFIKKGLMTKLAATKKPAKKAEKKAAPKAVKAEGAK
jgi:small subunit ribosomal protein S16